MPWWLAVTVAISSSGLTGCKRSSEVQALAPPTATAESVDLGAGVVAHEDAAERGTVPDLGTGGVVDADEAADRDAGRDDGGVVDIGRTTGGGGAIPAPDNNGFARRWW